MSDKIRVTQSGSKTLLETKQDRSRRELLDALSRKGHSKAYIQKVAKFLSTPIGNAILKTAISLGVMAGINLVISLVKK